MHAHVTPSRSGGQRCAAASPGVERRIAPVAERARIGVEFARVAVGAVYRMYEGARSGRITHTRDRGDTGTLEILGARGERAVQKIVGETRADDDERLAGQALARVGEVVGERKLPALEADDARERVQRDAGGAQRAVDLRLLVAHDRPGRGVSGGRHVASPPARSWPDAPRARCPCSSCQSRNTATGPSIWLPRQCHRACRRWVARGRPTGISSGEYSRRAQRAPVAMTTCVLPSLENVVRRQSVAAVEIDVGQALAAGRGASRARAPSRQAPAAGLEAQAAADLSAASATVTS